MTVILPSKHRAKRTISFIMGQADNVWRPTAIEDIAYFESYQKKTWLYTTDSVFNTEYTIQSLENRLPSSQFLRIHRSFIVNIAFIDYIQRDSRSNLVITLKHSEGTRLTVGQSYVKHVRETLGF